MANRPEDRDLLQQILARLPEAVWMAEPEKNRMLYVSPGYEKIWGRSSETLLQNPASRIDAVHPEDRERIRKAALSKQTPEEYEEEYRIVRPDGAIRSIHDRSFPIRNAEGKIDRIVGIAEDITERKEASASLRDGESRFSTIAEIAADAVIVMDHRHRITFFNKGAEKIFGYKAAEAVGRPLDLLLPPHSVERHREHVGAFGSGEEQARLMGERGSEISGRRKDGSEFPAEASIAKQTVNGKTFYAAVLRDITERKKVEQTIHQLAYYDPLTSLPNRALLRERLSQAILDGQWNGKPVALLLIDLDRFKEINDTLGHQRGDFLLQEVGSRLRESVRPSDTVARLGGDEFALVLPLAGSKDAEVVVKKIEKLLEPPFMIEGLPVAVEASIGIALQPDHGESADSLIQRADVAMYAAKRSGEGYLLYAPELNWHSPRRLALMGELRRAIEREELFLLYQPKIDLKSNRVSGMEALARWNHPEHGSIPPVDFIPAAEQTGLIRPLSLWVFKTAQHQCQIWRKMGKEFTISINLSVRNLQDPHLTDQLGEILAQRGGKIDHLEIEITESAIMVDPTRAMEAVKRLKEVGLGIWIDDFGIGYSSLAYLKKLPVDGIKIDKSFVLNMATDVDDAVIVRSTIDLGHNLGLNVVAEGVEDEETCGRLIEMGCDFAQGYYFARPLPAEELIPWLNKGSFL